MVLFVRLASAIILLGGVVYSLNKLRRDSYSPFFKCAFFAILCELMASIYYLALSTDNSMTELFTVGIFGEIGQILFILTANVSFTKKEEKEKRFSPLGFSVAVIIFVLLVMSIVFNHSLDNTLSAFLYIIVYLPCAYICVSNMHNRRKYPFKNCIYPYNLLTTVNIAASAFIQLANAVGIHYENENIIIYLYLWPYMLLSALSLVAVILLGRRLDEWKE